LCGQPCSGRADAARRWHRRKILFREAIAAEGAVVFAKACELGLEAIVSKRQGSLYKSGPSRNWLKAKNPAFART
jgi:ATP-dependent DNA ligase